MVRAYVGSKCAILRTHLCTAAMFRSSTSPALRHTRQQPVRTYITHRKDAKYSEIGANIGLRMHKQSSLDYRSGLATTPLPLRRGYNTYHAMISESESELSSGHHDPSESRFNPNTLSTMNSTVDSDSATTAIATHQVNPDTANVISLGSNSNTNMNTSKGPGVNDIDRAVGGVNGSVREVCGWNPDGDGHATELNAPNEQKRSSWSPRGRREKDNQNPLKLNLRIHPEAKNVLGAHQSLPSFRRDVDAIFAGKGSKRKLDEDLLINALNNIRKRLAISPTYRLEEFNRLVNRMRRANVKFSKNIYTELTNVGFEIDVSGKTGFHYMTEMKKHGHAVEGEPYFYCLSHLAEKGEIKTAERILTEMEKAGTATEDCYIPIIQALVKNGREKDRINYIFERARKADVLLGVKTYTQYIAAIAENPHLGLGEIVSVWDKMSNMGLAQNSHTARTAINAAENMSDLKVVVRMAKKAHVLEDAYVQRALVYSYANLYALKDVRRMLLQTHLDNHGQPRKLADFEGTMAGVLTRLGNKGNAQAKAEATTFLYNLVREEHILVNQKFCTQMMMYFTKAQQYSKTKEVFELLKTMKGGYDTHAANAMIHQLSIEGKITDAVELMAEVSRNPNCALDQFTIAPIINAAAKTDNAPMVAMLRQLSNQHQLPRFYTSLRAEFDMHVRMENFDMLLPIIQDMRELNRPFSADVCEIMMNLNLKRNNYTGAMTWFGKAISHDAHIPSNAYHWSPEVYVEAHRAIGVALADAGILDGYAELVPNQLHGQDEEEVLVMQDFVPQPQRHEQAVRQVANRRERRSHAKRGTPLADTQKDIIHVDAPKVTEHNAAHRISPKNSQARPMAQKTEPLHAGRGVWRTNYTPMTMVARDGQKASPLVVYGDDLLAEGQTEIYHHDIHEARQIMKLYRQLKETDPENPVMSTHELEETRELSRVGRDFVTWAVEAAAVPADQRQPAPKTSTEERRNHTNSVSQNSDAVAEARADEEMLTLESATHQPVTEVLKVSSKSNNKTRVSQNTTQENVSATASMGTNGQPHAESVATKSVAAARPVAPTSTAPQPGTRGSVEDQPSAHIPDTTRSRQPEATQHVAGDRNGPEPDSRTSAVDVGTAHTALGTTGGGVEKPADAHTHARAKTHAESQTQTDRPSRTVPSVSQGQITETRPDPQQTAEGTSAHEHMQTQTQTKTHPTQPETPAPTRATAGTHNPTATSSPPEHAPVQTHSIQQRRIEPAVQSAGATDETEQLHVVPRLPSQPTNVAQVGQPYKSAAAAVQSVGASDETEQLNVVPQLPSQPTNMARVAQPYKSAAAAFASLRGGNQLSDVMAAAHMREDDQNTGHIRAMGAKAGARAAVDMRRPLPIQNRTNMNSEYAKGNVVYIDTRLAPGMGGLNILRRRIAIGGKSRATPSPTPLPAFMPVDAEGTLDQRLNSYLQSIESKRVLHRGRNNGRNNAQLWDAIPVDLLRRRTAA